MADVIIRIGDKLGRLYEPKTLIEMLRWRRQEGQSDYSLIEEARRLQDMNPLERFYYLGARYRIQPGKYSVLLEGVADKTTTMTVVAALDKMARIDIDAVGTAAATFKSVWHQHGPTEATDSIDEWEGEFGELYEEQKRGQPLKLFHSEWRGWYTSREKPLDGKINQAVHDCPTDIGTIPIVVGRIFQVWDYPDLDVECTQVRVTHVIPQE